MRTNDRNRIKIAKAALCIEDKLTDPLRTWELAEHVHLSPFHFQRLFYAYFGESVGQYITARRLEWAASELINSPNINLLHLALDCGFQTHSGFSKAFRKQFGVSPSIFRKEPGRAQNGIDDQRRFLINDPPSKAIDAVEIVDLASFHLKYRLATGTKDGQFFAGNMPDIGQQFAELCAERTPPDLFLMSCFPDPPRLLSDSEASVWFGGAFTERRDSGWSNSWHTFNAGSWAVFEHRGPYEFLYQTWNRVYRNWLPQTEYILRDDIPFEAYLGPSDASDRSEKVTLIYIPIKKA